MKTSTLAAAILAASSIAFSPLIVRAQDQPPPPPADFNAGGPPPPDQGNAQPPPPDGSAPPPEQGYAAPDQGGGDSGASFQEFYDNLSSQGQWIQTDNYGYVFQPTVEDPEWAPYTAGHWVYTAYGWTWVSDEPWGWATYHYGRWVNIDGTGWCWVPGYTWAPAWVSWRYGGGYCGWAPLPPTTFVGVEFGGGGINLGFDFHFGSDCDTAFGIGPACYNFIPVSYIGNPYYRGYYVPRSRNFVVINNTTNITNIYVSRHPGNAFSAVRVQGPTLAQVNEHARTPVQEVRLARAGQAGRSTLSNGTLDVYTPRLSARSQREARPPTVARSLNNVQVNRGTSVAQPLQTSYRYKPSAPSAEAIAAARAAEAKAPSSVATSARVTPTVSAATLEQQRRQTLLQEQAQTRQRVGNDITNRQQTLSNEQAARQQRAESDIQARQQQATAAQQQRQAEAENLQSERQQRATEAQQARQQEATNLQQQRQKEAGNLQAEQQARAEAAQQQRQQEAEKLQSAQQARAEAAQQQRQQEAEKLQAAQQARAEAAQQQRQQEAQNLQAERAAQAQQQQHYAPAQGQGQGSGQQKNKQGYGNQ